MDLMKISGKAPLISREIWAFPKINGKLPLISREIWVFPNISGNFPFIFHTQEKSNEEYVLSGTDKNRETPVLAVL